MTTTKKAQAGLPLFLTVIAMIFVIGILIMAFSLTSATITSSSTAYDRTNAATVTNESHFMNGTIGYYDLTYSTLYSVQCSVSGISNGTELISTGNYSVSNCRVSNVSAYYDNETWYTNYTYTYLTPNLVSTVMNDTNLALSGATDWFAIFITIAAVVVLVLLIVLIIVSLRGAGLMGGGNQGA